MGIDDVAFPRRGAVRVFTGHYGSGKTEVSVSLAMRLAAQRCHIIAEGAGACAIAAALSPKVRAAGHKRIVVVVSGGNIDLSRFAAVVTE